MMFALSVLVGGIAAYALGVLWYMLLSGLWMAAANVLREDIGGGSAGGNGRSMVLTYPVTFLAWLAASFILQSHLFPMAAAADVNVFRLTIGMWLAFGLLSTLMSTLYGLHGLNLIWIDGGYVLAGGLLIAASYTFIAP